MLIAEDDLDLRELYRQRFATEFNILFAKDGQEAIDKILDEKPDLVLLDIMMPKKSGMDVLKEISSNYPSLKIPIVILTALPNESIKVDASRFGVRHYLVKSQILPHEVIRIVKEELGFADKVDNTQEDNTNE
ncbi:response regulator [bacterium CG06_land_8_20_14_3_00_33_50]|nr:MAG: response regulator [bacterium CG06_land_8_20_14_3_00_33_50]PIY85221.1 MAG: response regulator [bacterium CG_4_10_14_0_8_um_filter_33_57]PJA72081.1 MAG: response regulator [bacterium CG_4_9_14_3_um_filter_33_26]